MRGYYYVADEETNDIKENSLQNVTEDNTSNGMSMGETIVVTLILI